VAASIARRPCRSAAVRFLRPSANLNTDLTRLASESTRTRKIRRCPAKTTVASGNRRDPAKLPSPAHETSSGLLEFLHDAPDVTA
jgi:hypothetical protein